MKRGELLWKKNKILSGRLLGKMSICSGFVVSRMQTAAAYIGVDDNGQVIGVANAKRLLEDLPNKIRDTMGIVADINLLKEQEKEYIEITVPSYPVAISCKGAYY